MFSTLGFHWTQSLRFSLSCRLDNGSNLTGRLASASFMDHNCICESKPHVATTDWLNVLYWMSVMGPLCACVMLNVSLLKVSLRAKSSCRNVDTMPPDELSRANVMYFRLQLIRLPIVFDRRFVVIPLRICCS